MKLKPSLFQLIVILMTSSLIVSCNTYQQGSQVDCNNPNAKQSEECNPSSTRSSGGVYRGAGSSNLVAPSKEGNAANPANSTGNTTSESGSASKGSSSGGDSNSTSNSSSKSGRGGFGSSSSGKAGG